MNGGPRGSGGKGAAGRTATPSTRSSVGLVAAAALTLTVRLPFFVVVGSVATVTLAILLGM